MEKTANIAIMIGDITTLSCDCIVNAANRSLLGGGGVDGAIHRAAGKELLAECRTLGGCRIGEAKITKGYRLPANYVIHTVGPIYNANKDQSGLLADCYRESLKLARTYQIHSIAFPAISTGVYHYPLQEACRIAWRTVLQWLKENPDYEIKIIFCCFQQETYDMYQTLLQETQR